MSNFYKKKYITNRSLDQFGNFSVKLIFSASQRKLETKQMYMRLSVEKRGRERTTPRHSRREKSLRLDKINVSSVSKTKKRRKKREYRFACKMRWKMGARTGYIQGSTKRGDRTQQTATTPLLNKLKPPLSVRQPGVRGDDRGGSLHTPA